jgi:hypothetical protein
MNRKVLGHFGFQSIQAFAAALKDIHLGMVASPVGIDTGPFSRTQILYNIAIRIKQTDTGDFMVRNVFLPFCLPEQILSCKNRGVLIILLA